MTKFYWMVQFSVYIVSVKRNTLFAKICKNYCHYSKELHKFDFETELLRKWKALRAVRE
jgi:hypothetical protein